MHSRDPQKSTVQFQQEFERTLSLPDGGVANFSGFLFPIAAFSKRQFAVQCIFNRAVFVNGADFSGAVFSKGAIFSEAIFLQHANFLAAAFLAKAAFAWATFEHGANFTSSRFVQEPRFDCARFGHRIDLSAARFGGDARFNSAAFDDDVYFNLIRPAVVRSAGNTGNEPLRFPFLPTVFEKVADFREATFGARAEFRQTQFREDRTGEPSAIFSSARFDRPGAVVFDNVYLGQALFHNCDVSEILFTNVRWRTRTNARRMVFEEWEGLGLGRAETVALLPGGGSPDERNYGLIAEVYQQLKKNYDDRRDYWTAGEFHYGEMEMKRLATPNPNRLSKWVAGKMKAWLAKENPRFLASEAKRRGLSERSLHAFRRAWHQRYGLAAWYKRASEYGESYGRPLLGLVGTLAFFMLFFPISGLRPAAKSVPEPPAVEQPHSVTDSAPVLSYSNFVRYRSMEPGGARVTVWSLLGNSLMTAVGVAAFQRDLAYEPCYPWGRLFATVETVITSTLLALFLLAVKRQFRR
jgi:uncharacterized protein YjbI with pentapeptide repeats